MAPQALEARSAVADGSGVGEGLFVLTMCSTRCADGGMEGEDGMGWRPQGPGQGW